MRTPNPHLARFFKLMDDKMGVKLAFKIAKKPTTLKNAMRAYRKYLQDKGEIASCARRPQQCSVDLAYDGYSWLDMSWAVAHDSGACRGSMVCVGLRHAWTGSDR